MKGASGGGGAERDVVQGIFSKQVPLDLLPLTQVGAAGGQGHNVLSTAVSLVADTQ